MTLADDIARYANEGDYVAALDLKQAIAAGLEREKIIIDRADLPEVTTGSPVGHYFVNDQFYHRAARFREIALEHLAVAEHIAARESAEARLQERRDELVAELTGIEGERYNSIAVGLILRNAVDRIIELEAR